MICSCCGSQNLKFHPILWKQLIDEWQLSEHEVEYINRQQGLICLDCQSSLRTMALAMSIMKCWGYQGVFKDFISDSGFNNARILEVNEAGNLSQFLEKIPGRILSTYPPVDMMNLPYQEGQFDFVIHSDTLEHIKYPILALSECRRVLRNGGFCCFTVPTVVERLTISREGMPPSYHGSVAEKEADLLVYTEWGSDTWIQILKAGFPESRVYCLEYPSALAWVGVK